MKTTRRTGYLATCALLIVAACAVEEGGPVDPLRLVPDLAAAKGGPPKDVPVSLVMTVEVSGASGVYRIQGDGLGDYVNGQQGMQVEIDVPGNLQITPLNANSTTPPQRRLTFDYSAPVDPLNMYRPNEGEQWNFKIKTGNYLLPRIQDLGISGNPSAACYASTIAHGDHDSIDLRTVFNPPAGDVQSTLLYITRTSITPAIWTVMSNGPCTGIDNVAAVSSRDLLTKNAPLVFRGYFDQSLSLVLRGL